MEVSYFWIPICAILGFISGFCIGKIRKYDGFFKIDTTNPEKDVFTLELTCSLGELPTKKYITFMVLNTSSQEKHFP